MSPAVVAYLAHAAHLVAGAIWFGGLIAVCARGGRVPSAGHDPFGAAEAIATFSGWAFVASVVVVVADGLGLSRGRRLEALDHHYLRTPPRWPGGGRRRRVGSGGVEPLPVPPAPRVAAAAIEEPPVDDHQQAWPKLLRLVRANIGLIVVGLLLTGVLVNITPAKAAGERQSSPSPSRPSAAAPSMSLLIRRGGPNRHPPVHQHQGRQARPPYKDPRSASNYRPRTSVRSNGPGPLVAPGDFQLVVTPLALPGVWTIRVTVNPDPFTEQTAIVEVEIR